MSKPAKTQSLSSYEADVEIDKAVSLLACRGEHYFINGSVFKIGLHNKVFRWNGRCNCVGQIYDGEGEVGNWILSTLPALRIKKAWFNEEEIVA